MSDGLRLATFNVENLDDEADNPLAARIDILRPQFQRLDADIVCLQEVNGQQLRKGDRRRGLTALRTLVEGTPYADFTIVSTEGEHGPYDHHNLVVLSRFPVDAHRVIRHELMTPPSYRSVSAVPPDTEDEPIRFERPLLHLSIEAGLGRPLHVVNLHLRAPTAAPVAGQKLDAFTWRSSAGWAEGYFIAAMKRTGQALEARLLVDCLFDEDPQALVAVCGDFNAELNEIPVRMLMASEEDTGNGKLGHRALVALERGLPESRRHTVVHHGHGQMLDHILVSRALYGFFRELEIHNESLGDEVVGFSRVAHAPDSYHAPVVAAFALPKVAPR